MSDRKLLLLILHICNYEANDGIHKMNLLRLFLQRIEFIYELFFLTFTILYEFYYNKNDLSFDVIKKIVLFVQVINILFLHKDLHILLKKFICRLH